MNEALIQSTERIYQGLTVARRHMKVRFRKEVTFEQSPSANSSIGGILSKDKASKLTDEQRRVLDKASHQSGWQVAERAIGQGRVGRCDRWTWVWPDKLDNWNPPAWPQQPPEDLQWHLP